MPNRVQKTHPEFVGVEQYPQAIEALLRKPRSIGAVVIRQCFDPASVVFSDDSVSFGEVAPDGIAVQAGTEIMRKRWLKLGYEGTNVRSPSPDTLGKINNVISPKSDFDVLQRQRHAFGLFAVFESNLIARTLPGHDLRRSAKDRRESDIKVGIANNQNADIRKRIVRKNHEKIFSHGTSLRAGDMVIAMGLPVPSRIAFTKKDVDQTASYAPFYVSARVMG